MKQPPKRNRLRFLLPAALLLVGTLSSCAPAGDGGSSQPAVSIEIPKENPATVTIPAPSLAGNLLGDGTEQQITICLPPDYYESDRRYPVLYFLPGFEDPLSMYASDIGGILGVLYDGKRINDMIVVIVDGMNALDGSFFVNSPVSGNWEDYLVRDVVGAVDANLRTVKESGARGVAGHSMGGYGAINAAMHNKGLFGYAYAMSPGLFVEDGLSKTVVSFDLIASRTEKLADMGKEEAKQAFLTYARGLTWPDNFSFAYGAAFAGDPSLQAPFIALPAKNAEGGYEKDGVWKSYDAGFGNLSAKLDQYGDNLRALKGFVIDYGEQDEFSWIPEGCAYFSGLMTERNIPHTLLPYEGNHAGMIYSRLMEEVFPRFSSWFGAK